MDFRRLINTKKNLIIDLLDRSFLPTDYPNSDNLKKVLNSSNRLRILYLAKILDGVNYYQIHIDTKMNSNAIRKHVNILRDIGLVKLIKTTKNGRTTNIVKLNPNFEFLADWEIYNLMRGDKAQKILKDAEEKAIQRREEIRERFSKK